MTLEDEDIDEPVVSDEPEPDFAELAAAALDNAGIDANQRIQAAAQRANAAPGPALIEADDNEIVSVYEITFEMPDDGLVNNNVVPADVAGPMNNTVQELAHETVDILTDTDDTSRRYPTRQRRSVTRYASQTTFLQLGEVRAHRSVVDAIKLTGATKEERMHATTWTGTTMAQDDTDHVIDKGINDNVGGRVQSLGVRDDAIQSKAWSTEVWSKRYNGGGQGADTTARHGHVDGNGSLQDIARGENEGPFIPIIPEGKTNRED